MAEEHYVNAKPGMLRSKKACRAVLILTLISLAGMLLPWYKLGPESSAANGLACSPFAFVALLIVYIILNYGRNNIGFLLVCEVVLLTIPASYFVFLAYGPIFYVGHGPDLAFGRSVLQPTFWPAFAMSCVPAAVLPFLVWRDKHGAGRTERPAAC